MLKLEKLNKAHTTFIDSILRHQHKGRIHAEINQLRNAGGGTVTGRFSYQNPNLQQIPARNKDLGPKIRSLFIPEEGCKWGCFDYSQQEPRLVTHYASYISCIQHDCDTVINYGTAGGFNKELAGQLLHIGNIRQRDMDARPQAELGVTPFDTSGFAGDIKIPSR